MRPLAGWPAGQPIALVGVGVGRGGSAILRDIDLRFEPDRRVVLLGSSGSGKTTLLRLLNRLDDPDTGRVAVGDRDLRTIPPGLVRVAVGLVPAAARPWPGTVADNLSEPSRIARRPAPGRDHLAALLREVDLDPASLDRAARDLSSGERQRLAIAVALEADPEILVLDEPTAALDAATARRLADRITRRCRDGGLRTVIATHDRGLAPLLGDVAVRLDAGRVVDLGPVADVLDRTAPVEARS